MFLQRNKHVDGVNDHCQQRKSQVRELYTTFLLPLGLSARGGISVHVCTIMLRLVRIGVVFPWRCRYHDRGITTRHALSPATLQYGILFYPILVWVVSSRLSAAPRSLRKAEVRCSRKASCSVASFTCRERQEQSRHLLFIVPRLRACPWRPAKWTGFSVDFA